MKGSADIMDGIFALLWLGVLCLPLLFLVLGLLVFFCSIVMHLFSRRTRPDTGKIMITGSLLLALGVLGILGNMRACYGPPSTQPAIMPNNIMGG